mmetsp:Transcript_39490/g.123173  ORF Transcript_39490/g.123173 Transcript_39490/m.123173 type:complete len:359 (+) Transcript_39490:115-1191(+)
MWPERCRRKSPPSVVSQEAWMPSSCRWAALIPFVDRASFACFPLMLWSAARMSSFSWLSLACCACKTATRLFNVTSSRSATSACSARKASRAPWNDMSSFVLLRSGPCKASKSSLGKSSAEASCSRRVAFSKADRLPTSSFTVLRSCWRAPTSSAIAARREVDSARALPSFSACATAWWTGEADCSFCRKYWHHRAACAWRLPEAAAAPGCVNGSTFCKRCQSSASFCGASFAAASWRRVWLWSASPYVSSMELAVETREALPTTVDSSRNASGTFSPSWSLRASPTAASIVSRIDCATGSEPSVTEESWVRATAPPSSLAAAWTSSLAWAETPVLASPAAGCHAVYCLGRPPSSPYR